MNRNLKVLGAALAVVFAISAVMASAASAVDTFTSSQSTAVITGEGANNEFEITGAGFFNRCNVNKFTGTIANAASQITTRATYYKTTPDTKCDASFGTATVVMNGCDYNLTGSTTGSDFGTDATVWIACSGTNTIELKGPLGCTISILAQTPTSGGVTYTNGTDAGGKKDITVKATMTGLTYTSTAACGINGIPTHGNDGDYIGTITLKGYEDKCSAGECPLGSPEKDEFTDGNQINIEYSES